MSTEIDLYGIFVPALLVWTVLGLAVAAPLRWALERAGAYRMVWHRPLFDLALLVLVTGGLVAVARWISP